MAQVRVRLSEAQETLLVTLCGRAWDARARQPILGDTMAAAAVEQMDYDFRRAKVNPRVAASVAVRAKQFDDWTAEFLAEHDQAIVVHLAAGLDTRVWRVNPGPGVTWYDVDYPEVIALRSTLYPERGHYHMIGSSVTAPSWLAQVPADRPTLIVAEGLTMYLKPEEGHELMRRLTGHLRARDHRLRRLQPADHPGAASQPGGPRLRSQDVLGHRRPRQAGARQPTAALPRSGQGPLHSRSRRPAAQHPDYRQVVPPFPPASRHVPVPAL